MSERTLLENGLRALKLDFSPQAVDNLLRFSTLLLEKNKVMNLTAVTEPEEVVTRHFLDCLALSPYLPAGASVLDVGTGAGFPGLPLAILRSDCRFVLLDAQRKRIDFLNEVIEVLNLPNVCAVHARAEEFAKEHRASFDAAVSRAVAELRVLCELSLPMVKTGGAFLAMKAANCEDEVAAAKNARKILGAPQAELLFYTVPLAEIERALVRFVKTGETPEKYPRRFKKIETSPL